MPEAAPLRVLSLVHQPDAGSGVFAEVVSDRGGELDERCLPEGDPEPVVEGYDAVLVFGGSANVDEAERRPWLGTERELLRRAVATEVPVLGVCLGSQLLAASAGAPVRRLRSPEVGWVAVRATPEAPDDPVLGALPAETCACQWHSYCFDPPPGAVSLFENERGSQAFRLGASAWGIQFHAEVTAESLHRWSSTAKGRDEVRRAGVGLAELRAQTTARIGEWNRLGRGLCLRFLEVAAGRRPGKGTGLQSPIGS